MAEQAGEGGAVEGANPIPVDEDPGVVGGEEKEPIPIPQILNRDLPPVPAGEAQNRLSEAPLKEEVNTEAEIKKRKRAINRSASLAKAREAKRAKNERRIESLEQMLDRIIHVGDSVQRLQAEFGDSKSDLLQLRESIRAANEVSQQMMANQAQITESLKNIPEVLANHFPTHLAQHESRGLKIDNGRPYTSAAPRSEPVDERSLLRSREFVSF